MVYNLSKSFIYFFAILATSFFLSSCWEKEVESKDLEYRTDENGLRLLYEIGSKVPFGHEKRAFVVGKFTNGKVKYRIPFLNGLRDGKFSFYYPDETLKLTGDYEEGVRNGEFISYGRIGELVYKKNFANGILDGNFSLYYPASNHDVYKFKELKEESKLDLKVKDHLRLKTTFRNGNPSGKYALYYHPGNRKHLEIDDLLKEEGYFNEDGLLSDSQIKFYPKTKKLFVVLPDPDLPKIEFPPSNIGFSRAIDTARSATLELPPHRNPQKKPATIYTADEKDNLIAPIWSSNVEKIILKNTSSSSIVEEYDPNYEAFANDALPKALELIETERKSENPIPKFQIVGTDLNGSSVLDILWESKLSKNVIPLNERIFFKRTKTQRSWEQGSALTSSWFLNDGSKLPLRSENSSVVKDDF